MLLTELVCQRDDLWNRSRNAEPGICLCSLAIVLPVDPKIRVIQPLDKPVFPPVLVREPWLNASWLISVVVAAGLFV